MKLILASKSPRRKEILEKEGYGFSIISSSGEYDISGKKYDDILLLSCVESKLEGVVEKINDASKVILADTVVVCDDTIIGKPKDKNDAINILENLSNKTHFVATCVMVVEVNNKKTIDKKYDISKTYVTFRKLTKDEIIKYIDTCNPLDKAGSYGIQDEGFDFATKIDGDTDNVIGLPMKIVRKLIS